MSLDASGGPKHPLVDAQAEREWRHDSGIRMGLSLIRIPLFAYTLVSCRLTNVDAFGAWLSSYAAELAVRGARASMRPAVAARLRSVRPTKPKPTIINNHAAGSGTGAAVAITITPVPACSANFT